MRTVDNDQALPLGAPIRTALLPVPPRRFNTDGTIMQRSDGKIETAIPTPPPPIWGFFGIVP